MPLVEVDEVMSGPAQRIWDRINAVEAYPDMMDAVRAVRVLERGSDFRVTSWEVDLDGFILEWIEREEIDPERYRIGFQQVKGLLDEYAGYWQITPLPDGTCRVVLSVQFDLGVPSLCQMLTPIAERAIRENSKRMLSSLASRTDGVEAGRR
jgi:ribosome-associated toxin RatA of RatAB toxin-antitoxin module